MRRHASANAEMFPGIDEQIDVQLFNQTHMLLWGGGVGGDYVYRALMWGGGPTKILIWIAGDVQVRL